MTPTITTLPGGAYLIQVGNRRSIVSSAHLVDERIKQLSRPGWGKPPMTLPFDYARCWGLIDHDLQSVDVHPQCLDCLRRTAPCDGNRLYSYMQPPEFTDHCPERIAS